MTNIIIKSIDLIAKTAINKDDEVISLEPLTAYLVPLKDGTTEHERYVTDKDNVISKQSSGEIDTLETVTQRGNIISKPIIFKDAEQGTLAIYSDANYSWGNMNPSVTGMWNMGFGTGALTSITSGNDNTAIGVESLTKTTTGYYNVGIGSQSLARVTVGTGNVGIGPFAMESGSVLLDITGKHNIGVGAAALGNLSTGNWNLGIGTGSLSRITSGNGNIAIGYSASSGTETGSNNVVIGNYVGPLRNEETSISNKLIIHNYLPTLKSSTFYDGLPSTQSIYNQALIYGDFVDRTLNINGRFSVTPDKLPNADTTFTKNIVAKPNGTFGWEDRVTVPAPPATGTAFLKSVEGVMTWIIQETEIG